MRCPSCNKFVSHEHTAELQDVQFDGNDVDVGYRMVLACEECGEELAEYNDELCDYVDSHFTCDCIDDHNNGKGSFPEIEHTGEEDPVCEDLFAGKGKKGRQKHFYFATLNIQIECSECNETGTISLSTPQVQANSFEELN